MDIKSLRAARDHWYEAFYSGDLNRLASCESNAFTLVSHRGIQSKQSQINAVGDAISRKSWFAAGTKKVDYEISFREVGQCCLVAGRGTTITQGVSGRLMAFTECWSWNGHAWQVENLHYTELSEARA